MSLPLPVVAMLSTKRTETSDKNEKNRLEELTKRQTPVQAIRIATLGRMSELGLVDWEITEGKSKYTLGKDEFIKDILND